METERQVKLSTAEMANLWTSYMNDSMAIYVITHFLKHVEYHEIRCVLDYALHLSNQHIETVTALLNEESFPTPHGFTEKDVDLSAPRLYSDTFYLYYIQTMASFGSSAYTVALSNAVRPDIRKFYTECGESAAELFNKSTDLMLSKGLFLRPPQITTPQQAYYVQKQSFLAGWFGDRRPLTSIEIMNLFFNIQRNAIGKSLLIGFSQVAKSKEVQDYMVRGKDITSKHIEVFGSLLSEIDLPASMTWGTMPTESTIAPFSDKLMMFHTSVLAAAGTGYYGAALGTSQRRDLASHYTRLIAETVQYAEDGAIIMINNAWLEQPPTATDRDALVRGKK
jgi:hypothetical protein